MQTFSAQDFHDVPFKERLLSYGPRRMRKCEADNCCRFCICGSRTIDRLRLDSIHGATDCAKRSASHRLGANELRCSMSKAA